MRGTPAVTARAATRRPRRKETTMSKTVITAEPGVPQVIARLEAR
ncbi:MAG: hypothetical protein ACHP9Z_20645 [Streptosporangiales bacterium]